MKKILVYLRYIFTADTTYPFSSYIFVKITLTISFIVNHHHHHQLTPHPQLTIEDGEAEYILSRLNLDES